MPYTIIKEKSGYWVVKLPNKTKVHKKAYRDRKKAVAYLMRLREVTEEE